MFGYTLAFLIGRNMGAGGGSAVPLGEVSFWTLAAYICAAALFALWRVWADVKTSRASADRARLAAEKSAETQREIYQREITT